VTVHGENLNSVAEPRIEVTTFISTVVTNDTNQMAGSGSDLNTTRTFNISDVSTACSYLYFTLVS